MSSTTSWCSCFSKGPVTQATQTQTTKVQAIIPPKQVQRKVSTSLTRVEEPGLDKTQAVASLKFNTPMDDSTVTSGSEKKLNATLLAPKAADKSS